MGKWGEPANEDCVEGYMDGYDLNCPEPSANRSASYRHGFVCGRADKRGKPAFGSMKAALNAYDTAVLSDLAA